MKTKRIAIIAFPSQFLQGIFMIFRMLFGGRGQREQLEVAVHNSDGHSDTAKYDNMLGGPTAEIASGTQPVFCPKCHHLVAHTRETDQGTEIFQNGRKLITVADNVICNNSKKQSGFPIRCPNGHTVTIASPVQGGKI